MASATPLDALEAPSGALPSAPSTQTESADGYAPAQPATFGAESLTYFWQSKVWAEHGSTQAVTDSGSFGCPGDTFPARSGIDLRFCVGSSTLQFWRTFHCGMGHGASGSPTIYDMPSSRGWGYVVSHQSWFNPANPATPSARS